MTRTDERSAEAKARKQARKDALGRSGRILSTPLKPGERMKHNYSDDDLRVGRAAQQKGTRFSKSLAQRQAADTRPNKKYGYTKVRDKGINSSTELVRGARLALAEAILREMKVLRMTPLANRLPKNKGGRGYAQLDTIDQMKVRHDKAMEKLRKNNRTISDEDDEKGRHIQTTPKYRTDQFRTGTGNYMNRGKKQPPN